MASKCMYCGSEAIGCGCPYGPKNIHVHPGNAGRCIYCGSQAMGTGCSVNPNGNVHVHGVDYNNMVKETLHNGVVTGLMMKKLSLPYREWPACKLGIIDENGKQLKRPVTIEERASFSNNDAYILRLKRLLNENQIELLNNSIYLAASKEDTTDIKLFAEKYSKEIDTQNQIKSLMEQLNHIVSNAYNNGLKTNEIEKMIVEAISQS